MPLPVAEAYTGIFVGGRLGNDLGTPLRVGSTLGLRLGLFSLTKEDEINRILGSPNPIFKTMVEKLKPDGVNFTSKEEKLSHYVV